MNAPMKRLMQTWVTQREPIGDVNDMVCINTSVVSVTANKNKAASEI